MEILEEVPFEKWQEREKYHIARLPNLVNSHPGGNAPAPRRGVHLSEEHRRKISESQKGKVISEEHKEILRKKKGPAHHLWGKKLPSGHVNRIASGHCKSVAQYDNAGNLIAVFKSQKEATEITGVGGNSISTCIHGKRHLAGGFVWRLVGRGEEPAEVIQVEIRDGRKVGVDTTPRAVEQQTADGVVIKTWSSLRNAAKSLGLYPAGINKCIAGDSDLYGGFRWAYSETIKGAQMLSDLGPPVFQINKSGEILKVWSSIYEASRTLGMPFGYISRCVRGVRESCLGFRWADATDFCDMLEAM